MAAQTDPHDDRKLGLVGGVIGAGHGVWCSEGHGQGQMQAQIAIARLTIAYQKDLILWIGRKKRAIAAPMVGARSSSQL